MRRLSALFREAGSGVDRWLPWLVVALALGFYLGLRRSQPTIYDDAYIILRVARNLAEGNGLVFNPGDPEPAITATSSLYAWVCGGVFAVFGERTLQIVAQFGALAMALAAAGVYQITREALLSTVSRTQGRIWALVAAGCFGLTFATATVATSGMESSLYTLAIVLYFGSLRAQPTSPAERPTDLPQGLLAALPALIRPEGILVSLIAVGAVLVRNRRKLRQTVAFLFGVGVPVAIYYTALYWYFDAVVPQSVLAKSHLRVDRLTMVLEFLRTYILSPQRLPIGTLALYGAAVAARRVPHLRPFLLWAAVYAMTFTLWTRWWPWHKPPFVAAYYVCFAIGTAHLIKSAQSAAIKMKTKKEAMKAWIGKGAEWIAMAAATLLVCELALHAAIDTDAAFINWRGRTKGAEGVAAAIRQDERPGTTVLLEPLGLISYLLPEYRFADFPGLASRVACDLQEKFGRATPSGPVYGAIIEALRPDYLVLYPWEMTSLQGQTALARYEEIAVAENSIFRARTLPASVASHHVFRRREASP